MRVAEAAGVAPPRGHWPVWPVWVAGALCEAACGHIYNDCGFALGNEAGQTLDEQACIAECGSTQPEVIDCLSVVACDVNMVNGCFFTTRDGCTDETIGTTPAAQFYQAFVYEKKANGLHRVISQDGYHKPLGNRRATMAVARGRFDGTSIVDMTDIFVAKSPTTVASTRLAFGLDGSLFVTTTADDSRAQDPGEYGGKILRLTDEGKVPPDNPFVGRTDARPEIFTMGHRTFLRMARHPLTGAIWQIENGPNGGDEVNILTAGANYGWPPISLGRTYGGPWQGPFTKEGFRDPIVYWMPAIAVSSITFYTGDRFPTWKGSLFVGGLAGQLLHRVVFTERGPIGREGLIPELRQRIRDVRQGPDGLLYLLVDANPGGILRLEPAGSGSTTN